MGNKINRVVVALLIGFTFPIFAGNQVASAAPAVSGTLGDSCVTPFISRLIAADSTGTTEIAGVCFPSLNNPDIFIWSKDNNPVPAYTLVTDNDGKIAFGRGCVINDQNDCFIPDPKPSGYLESEPFVRAYPDTRHFADNNNLSRFSETFGGIWWSETYYSNIVAANYVAPEAVVDVEDATQINEPSSSQAVSSTLLIGLAAAVSLTSAARSSSGQQSSPRPESPDAPELLRARKERRFAIVNQLDRILLGSVISGDRWNLFTRKTPALIRWFGKFSSAAATSIGDADYLRAVMGIFSLLIYPLAIAIGVFESNHLASGSFLIPGMLWLTVALILGCFDSLAGAISVITFIILATIKLDPSSRYTKEYFATLGMLFAITAGPGLFAGALRRFDGVHTHRNGKWERLVDYALSPIITAWVVWKGLELLPTIGKEGISESLAGIDQIAKIVFVCIFLRYFIEGYVAKHFAERINEIVTESIPMQKWFKTALHIRRGFWISFIASILLFPNEFLNTSIWVLFILLVLPALVLVLGMKPTDKIAKINTIGAPRLAILLCAGLLVDFIFTDGNWTDQIPLFMGLAFAPILYFNSMETLTESHLKLPAYFYQTRVGRFLYRLSSTLLYILILSILYHQVKG